MTIEYAKTAWADIKQSPNWFGKLLLLALVSLIPIFGTIVVYGYLLNWAREIAWGYKTPLPARIFGNEQGNLYKLGFFALLVSIVVGIIVSAAEGLLDGGNALSSLAAYGNNGYYFMGNLMGMALTSSVVVLALSIFLTIFNYASWARMSIYGTLSSGFQVDKLWQMIRFDTKGILKIVGMSLLFGLIMGIVIAVLVFIIVFVFIGVAIGASYDYGYATNYSLYHLMGLGMGSIGLLLLLLVVVYVASVMSVFIDMMVIRALGYWTSQMKVNEWGPQDAPLPVAPPRPQPYNVAAQGQPQQPYEPYAPQYQQQWPTQPQQQWQQPVQQAPMPQQQTPVQPAPQPQPQAPVQPAPAQSEAPVQPEAQAPAEQQPTTSDTPAESASHEETQH